MNLKPYPKYKPSGIEWLGNIPEHWKVTRLRHVLVRNDGGVWGEDDDPDGTVVLRSTEQSVDGGWQINEPARRNLTAKEKSAALLEAGDLVVTKSSGSALHIGKTSFVSDEVAALHPCYSNFMQRLRVTPGVEPRLVWYILNSPTGRQQLVFNSNTTTGLANLNGGVLANVFITTASLTEQLTIVAFLDREIGRLDQLVEKKRALAERIKEKRAALISRTVTRGISPIAAGDSCVPESRYLKPSGVEWLADIPKHWRMLRLKYISPRISGRLVFQPAQYFDVEGVPFLMGNNVTERGIKWDEVKLIPTEINERFAHHALKEGDVITVRVGAPGLTCVVPREAEGLNCGSLMIIRRSTKFDPHWLSAVMNSFIVRTQIDLVQYGAAQEQINISDAVDFLIPTPPLREQRAIAAYLDVETTKMNRLLAKIEEAVERLQEYRTALITAAVTGKIDVRRESHGG